MQLRKRTIALGGAAAMIAATGLTGSTMGTAADASSRTFHLRFVAVSDRSISFGPRTFGGTEIERSQGHRVGFDTISGIFDPATETVKIYVSVARRGGLLFARVHTNAQRPNSYVGRVTGGSGKFKGAQGTAFARDLDHQRTRVMVTYTLP